MLKAQNSLKVLKNYVRKHKKIFGNPSLRDLTLWCKPKIIFFTLEIVPIGNLKKKAL